MLHFNSYPGQGTIISPLLVIQWVVLGRFERQPCQRMNLRQTLIAPISTAVGTRVKAHGLPSAQGFVMARASRKRRREHDTATGFNQQLSLEGMALFLATVVTALFFLGRSIGVSLASIKTSSSSSPNSSARWRLGRLKRHETNKRRSTGVTIRWALDSCTPKHAPT